MTHPPTIGYPPGTNGSAMIIDLLRRADVPSAIIALIPPQELEELGERVRRGEFTERSLGKVNGLPADMIDAERLATAVRPLIDRAERRAAP